MKHQGAWHMAWASWAGRSLCSYHPCNDPLHFSSGFSGAGLFIPSKYGPRACQSAHHRVAEDYMSSHCGETGPRVGICNGSGTLGKGWVCQRLGRPSELNQVMIAKGVQWSPLYQGPVSWEGPAWSGPWLAGLALCHLAQPRSAAGSGPGPLLLVSLEVFRSSLTATVSLLFLSLHVCILDKSEGSS